MRTITNEYKKLYSSGMSTYEIAKHLKKSPAAVRAVLRRWGFIKPSLGTIVENKVEKWLIGNGKKVIRQKGDAPFDMLVNGKRIDVKSANLCIQKNQKPCYKFQLHDGANSGEKDLSSYIDFFYLVFLGKSGTPIYSLDIEQVTANYTLSIPDSNKTKYELKFMGFLGEI